MLRDEIAACPRCRRGLDPNGRRLVCGGCTGVLVTEAELRELIAEMGVTSVTPVQAVDAGERALPFEPPDAVDRLEQMIECPRCAARMAKHRLYGMTVDRCEAHGVWFDGQELEGALAKVGEEAARMPLGSKIAVAAVGTVWIAFHLASMLLNSGR